MGTYKCLICEKTGKPYKKFEDVEYLDINFHFSRHHPMEWRDMMNHLAVNINGEWVKPDSVEVGNIKKEIDKKVAEVIKKDKLPPAKEELPPAKEELPPAKDD